MKGKNQHFFYFKKYQKDEQKIGESDPIPTLPFAR